MERYGERLAAAVKAGRVRFMGAVPQTELCGWMEAMDLIVVPGAAPQSTPTKIFEAAALGRPMLLPGTDPIRKLCRDGAEAVLFDPESRASLVEAVRAWMRDPAPVARASAALRERILRDHTWDREAGRLAEWFEELRSAKRR